MGSQRYCTRKISIFLHIFLLILVQVSLQEIEHTKSFVLSFHQMVPRKDVYYSWEAHSEKSSAWTPDCSQNYRIVQRDSKNANGELSARGSRATRSFPWGPTPRTDLYTVVQVFHNLVAKETDGEKIHPSANSSNSGLTGTCMHPEKRGDVCCFYQNHCRGCVIMKSKE